jgi:hypothetical protein
MVDVFAFIDGVGFDPFFRGLLSVLVGVVVLIGGSYLLVATNSGARTGGLIAASALFGWMFLMGIVWTVYAIGWRGEGESWTLLEINGDNPASDNDGLFFAENERVAELGLDLEQNSVAVGVTTDDPDLAQAEAVEYARENAGLFADWRYLATSDPRRGEASASAEEFLIEEGVYDSPAEFVPLTYGAWDVGGKPLLDPEISADDPTKGAWEELFTDAPTRILHKLDTTFIHFWHPQELVAVQFQGVIDQPTLPGQAPPVARPDENKAIYTVVLERDRGGPLPALFGGQRVTPALFAIFNGILFAVISWMMHTRDKREQKIRASAAAA